MELKNKLSDYIVSIENFLPNSKNQKLREILDFNFFQFEKAKINTGATKENHIDNKVRITEMFHLSNTSHSMTVIHWCNYLATALMESSKKYSEITNTNFLAEIVDIQILKYLEGGFYKTHIDSGKNTPRTLSYVYFINDDYKGGELIFELPTNEVIKVDVQKNKLIMFPSNFLYPHKVLPVEEGVKYSVVSWAL